MRQIAAVLLALLAGACTLIDQNTFNPEAGKAPVIAAAPKPPPPPPPGPPPLLVISPGAAASSYVDVLKRAVASARARKPTVVFDVVEMQKPDADSAAAPALLGSGAAAIGRIIVDQGVAPARVRLVARPDADAPAQEVRVYVR